MITKIAFIALLALLPTFSSAASTTFTNGHMGPKGKGGPAQETDVAVGITEKVAVVEETTPWIETAAEVTEMTKEQIIEQEQATESILADVVEEPSPKKPKTHDELVAEELQRRAEEQLRRDEELKLRAEEQVRREEELKARAEEEIRREAELMARTGEEVKRKAELEQRQQEELNRKAEIEERLKEDIRREIELELRLEAEQSTGPTPLAKEDVAVELENVQQSSNIQADEPTGVRDKRQHDGTLAPVDQTEVPAFIVHQENLDRKEQIEIEQLDKGIKHEAAGVEQHQREAYDHSQFTNNQEELIKQQELERQRQEEERLRLEELRIKKDKERHMVESHFHANTGHGTATLTGHSGQPVAAGNPATYVSNGSSGQTLGYTLYSLLFVFTLLI